jgi:hypothetical protein
MLVPLRTGNAPLENTEEEYNTIRLLSMTDADATARQPDKKTQVAVTAQYRPISRPNVPNMNTDRVPFHPVHILFLTHHHFPWCTVCVQLMGKKQAVTKDAMGAYTSAIEFVVDNPRTLLLGRVAPKFASMREEAEEKVRVARENKAKNGGDPKRAQLDMVQGRRQRFVDFKVHTHTHTHTLPHTQMDRYNPILCVSVSAPPLLTLTLTMTIHPPLSPPFSSCHRHGTRPLSTT